jgi:glycosyltransferase involved in cell wall biosynthesis
MRILFFSYAFPSPWTPQQGTFNRTLLEPLTQRHDVRVVCPVPFMNYWKKRFRVDATRSMSTVPTTYVPFYYPPKLLHTRYHHFLQWSTREVMRDTLRDWRPDVLVSYWTHPDGTTALDFAREFDIPLAVITGGSDVLLLGRNGRRGELIRETLKRADAVIPIGHHIGDVLTADGVDPANIHPIYRGVDRELFYPDCPRQARAELGIARDVPLVVGVGRLVPVKSWPTVIDAMARLAAGGLKYECRIIGDGPLRSRLQNQIDTAGLTETVKLIPAQRQGELAKWYRAADLAVLTSLSEGVPNVLMEAMACGTPFVATRVGAIPAIADGFYDRLVPPKNPSLLAEAIVDSVTQRHFAPLDVPRRWMPPTSEEATRRLESILTSIALDPPPGRIEQTETCLPEFAMVP